MSESPQNIKPEDCPTPEYHATHHYCPSCSFVSDEQQARSNERSRVEADLNERLNKAESEVRFLRTILSLLSPSKRGST